MTEVVQIVSRLEEIGGTLVLDGDRIHYKIPSGDTEVQRLLAQLRRQRERVRTLLLQREADRFTRPHTKLFPFLGRKVRTPGGPGTLLQVFAERVTVLLDSELSRCSFFWPTEIEPVSSEP